MRPLSTFLIALALIVSATAADAADKRPINEKDLFNFIWIADPQVSPDGSRVAFVRVSANEKKEGYDTSLWVVSTAGGEEPHRLTTGNRDSSPQWSPDGKFIAFIRTAEKEGKPEPGQLCMLPMAGGDAWQFTSLPKGAGNPVWSPDGKAIAFTSSTNPEDLAKAERKKRKEEEAKRAAVENPDASAKPAASPIASADEPEKRESDVKVIARAVYQRDNQGYLDPKRPSHIWTIQAPRTADDKVQPKQLTSGRFAEEDALWSKDGSQIYFTSLRVDEPYYERQRTELYSIAAGGGEPTKIATVPMGMNEIALSPDGKRLAFVASATQPVYSYTQPDLWVLDLAPNAEAKNLTGSFDFDITNPVFGDQAPPRAGGGNPTVWAADGKSIYQIFSRQGRTNIGRFDATTGALTEITKGDHATLRFRVTPDSSKVVYLLSTPTRIGDLFVIDGNSAPRQLTDINRELFAQLNLTEPEEIWYDSFDGKKVQTWVQKPPGFDAKKKHPLILNIHGGPHAAYGWVFSHEFQWMAAKGYVVLYPNPRGSTTYGQEFGNIIQHRYPGDDYKDLMIGVDELIRRGYIDDKKMGVTGGSGGGLLTNWTITQTDRFAAAVSQRDISNWESWWYTADFTLFQPTWFKGPPFEQEEDFRARSPLTYVENVKTPSMFVLGETDLRTPEDSGGEQMFRALKYRKIPTVLVKFPNESHELNRSGQPWHRVERLQHIVGWFDKWLMGAAKPEYDVAPEAPATKKAN